jgi:hypothetical protein
MADTREKAVATAYEYQQGNIAGLDDAMTRRLIASVVLSESRGGDLAVTNQAGFVGRYQAGAQWLAEAGYVDQDKLKAAMGEHRSEWSWAKSGGMTQFLEDSSNWKNGLSLEKYKQSAELQDSAFKHHADAAFGRAVNQGVLSGNETSERVAGFLKAEHMAGFGAATAALSGGRAVRDVNGNSNYDFMHDITRNRDGLGALMSQYQSQSANNGAKVDVITGEDKMGEQKIGAIVRNPDLPSIAYTSDADHRLYKDAIDKISKLPGNAFRNDEERQNAAAAIALEAKEHGLSKIDHVTFNKNGDKLIAVEGDMRDPAHKRADVNVAEVVNKSSERSIEEANQLNLAQQTASRKLQEEKQLEDPQKIQRDNPGKTLG